MKVTYIPKDQRIVPPWVDGYRPWVVVAKLVGETDKAAK